MNQDQAAIYERISDDREGRELGVERQEQDCLGLADHRGYHVDRRSYEDGGNIYRDNDVSASTRSRRVRPAYRSLIADAQAGRFNVIIAYTSSRLTRRPREHEDLIELAERHGVRFEYVRSPSFDLGTAAGRRVARILAANDAGEAEDAAERITRQKAQSASLGRWMGGPRPYGYEADGVTPVPSEAADLLYLTERALLGVGIASLAAEMNRRGRLTANGKLWDGTGLRRTLIRPRNAGLMEHQGRVVGPASWPAVVPEELWRSVVALLCDPRRRTNTSMSGRRWLGSGLYRCGVCGAMVVGTTAPQCRPHMKPHYKCRAARHLARNCAEVDALVSGVVVERLSRPDAVDLLHQGRSVDVVGLEALAAGLRGRLDELAALFAAGDVTGSQLRTGSESMRAELAQVEAQLATAVRGSVFAGVVGAVDVAAAWKGLDLGRRRTIVHALLDVELRPSAMGRPAGWRPGESYFRPESVVITPRL